MLHMKPSLMSPCTYVNKGPRAGPDASTLTRIRQRDVPDDRCYECCRRVRLRLLPPQTPTTTTPNDLQAPGQGHSAEIGPVLDMGASMDRLSLTHLWPPPPRHATPPRPSRRDAAACLSTLAGSVPKPPPTRPQGKCRGGAVATMEQDMGHPPLRPVAHLSTASRAVFCPITLGGGDI